MPDLPTSTAIFPNLTLLTLIFLNLLLPNHQVPTFSSLNSFFLFHYYIYINTHTHCNEDVIGKLTKSRSQKSSKPKFVYGKKK